MPHTLPTQTRIDPSASTSVFILVAAPATKLRGCRQRVHGLRCVLLLDQVFVCSRSLESADVQNADRYGGEDAKCQRDDVAHAINSRRALIWRMALRSAVRTDSRDTPRRLPTCS